MMGDILRAPSTTSYGCCAWDSDPRWTMLKTLDVLESTRISEISHIQSEEKSFDSSRDSYPMAAILEIGERANQSNNNSGQSETKKMYQAYKGQLRLSISVTNGYLNVHVHEARHLSTQSGANCSTYVQVDMIPKISRRTLCKTATVGQTTHPLFEEKFTYELLGRDYQRRILISVYQTDKAESTKQLVGNMSFGIRNLAEKNTKVEGYYFLLAEKIGQQKHMKVHGADDVNTPTTPLQSSSQFRATVPTPGRQPAPTTRTSTQNSHTTTAACQKRALTATPRSSTVRGRTPLRSAKRLRKSSQGSSSCSSSGSETESVASDDRLFAETQAMLSLPMYTTPSDPSYGLHLAQGCPTVVARVESGSPAHRAGLREGDRVVAINSRPVHDMYPDAVATVIKYYSRCALVDVMRDITPNGLIGLDVAVPVSESDSYGNDDIFEVTESHKNVRAYSRERSVIGRREQALSQLSTPAVAKRDIVPVVKLSSKKKFFKLF